MTQVSCNQKSYRFKELVAWVMNHSIFELFNTIFVRFLVLGLNFFATTLITRALSVEDRGKYAILLNLIYLLMTFFTFGFHTSIVYFISNNKSLFSVFYIISLGLVIISTVLLYFLSLGDFIGFLFPTLSHMDNYILVFGAPLVIFSYFSSFFFLSVNEYNKYNMMEFVKTFVFLGLTLLFFKFVLDYATYITFFIIGNFVHIILSLYLFRKLGHVQWKDFHIIRNFRTYIDLIKKEFQCFDNIKHCLYSGVSTEQILSLFPGFIFRC